MAAGSCVASPARAAASSRSLASASRESCRRRLRRTGALATAHEQRLRGEELAVEPSRAARHRTQRIQAAAAADATPLERGQQRAAVIRTSRRAAASAASSPSSPASAGSPPA